MAAASVFRGNARYRHISSTERFGKPGQACTETPQLISDHSNRPQDLRCQDSSRCSPRKACRWPLTNPSTTECMIVPFPTNAGLAAFCELHCQQVVYYVAWNQISQRQGHPGSCCRRSAVARGQSTAQCTPLFSSQEHGSRSCGYKSTAARYQRTAGSTLIWGACCCCLCGSSGTPYVALHPCSRVPSRQPGGRQHCVSDDGVPAPARHRVNCDSRKRQYEQITEEVPVNPPLQPGDIAGMISRITGDFQRAYFVTGVIDDSIYDPNCTFADPTVTFSGLDLWKRNLQLLVPFLIQPEIQLISINQIQSSPEGTQRLQAEWTLQTTLALPWRPFIDVLGSTVYTLNSDGNKVVLHVESWNITATQALQQVFIPGGGRRS